VSEVIRFFKVSSFLSCFLVWDMILLYFHLQDRIRIVMKKHRWLLNLRIFLKELGR